MSDYRMPLTDRQISTEWQSILEKREMMQHGACASTERYPNGGRYLLLRNGPLRAEISIQPMDLERSIDDFVASILAPGVALLS